MINEEKVRELFNIALCDSKSDDSRVQKQSASYYGWDYIWKESLKSFFTGTFAFAGLVVMWVAVNAAELLDRINKLDFRHIADIQIYCYKCDKCNGKSHNRKYKVLILTAKFDCLILNFQ